MKRCVRRAKRWNGIKQQTRSLYYSRTVRLANKNIFEDVADLPDENETSEMARERTGKYYSSTDDQKLESEEDKKKHDLKRSRNSNYQPAIMDIMNRLRKESDPRYQFDAQDLVKRYSKAQKYKDSKTLDDHDGIDYEAIHRARKQRKEDEGYEPTTF